MDRPEGAADDQLLGWLFHCGVLRSGQSRRFGRGVDGQLQGTGEMARTIATLRRGSTVEITTSLRDGTRALARKGVSVINGGPLLIKDGQIEITQRQDGMNHTTNPSFDYGWVLQRNPRTIAGVDAAGRSMFVTVDGRQPGDLGLSIPEAAAVAQSLGMVDAINLDGGGSTAMVVKNKLISRPSDTTGERAVGDAIMIGPRH